MLTKTLLNPKTIRKHILTMAYKGQSVHVACAFSIVELLISILEKMNFDPKDPDRDYLVLSKGHGAMALYACMFEMGILTQSDMDNYFKDGSLLHGLSEAGLPGIDVTAGSLGHGLPIAVGIALGLRRAGKTARVHCIVGDGEMQEGSCDEALRFAGHHKLNNLRVYVDRNGLQAMGTTEDILNGDRHPVSVWDTTKGRGVSFMEDKNIWHYTRLDAETYAQAMAELA